MSLEAALVENTAALNRVAELLEISNAGREAAIAAATAIQSGEGTTKTTRKKTQAASSDAGATTTTETTAPAGPPSVDDLRGAFGTYLGVEGVAERETRKGYVKKILAHFSVEKATDIAEGDRAQAIAWVQSLGAGTVPAELADPAEEEPSLI